jgi:hypothetical protein
MDEREAKSDYDLLQSTGGSVHPGLIKKYNPWASQIRLLKAFDPKAWQSYNGWICAGFR